MAHSLRRPLTCRDVTCCRVRLTKQWNQASATSSGCSPEAYQPTLIPGFRLSTGVPHLDSRAVYPWDASNSHLISQWLCSLLCGGIVIVEWLRATMWASVPLWMRSRLAEIRLLTVLLYVVSWKLSAKLGTGIRSALHLCGRRCFAMVCIVVVQLGRSMSGLHKDRH
jgi:hypothetical protein